MTAPSAPETILYPAEQVAKRLSVSLKTVRRWIEAGDLPIVRLGRSVRVSQADLATFVERCRQS